MIIVFEFGDGKSSRFEIDEGYGTGKYFELLDTLNLYPHLGKIIKLENKQWKRNPKMI